MPGADRSHPDLRSLRTQSEELVRAMTEVAAQISYKRRELRKQQQEVRDLERNLSRLESSYRGLRRAKMVSLDETKQVRLLLAATRDLLTVARKKARKIDKEASLLEESLPQIQRDLKRVGKELAGWNKIIKLRRRKK